jgi:hypothetical protein
LSDLLEVTPELTPFRGAQNCANKAEPFGDEIALFGLDTLRP